MKAEELMIGDWVVLDKPDRYAGCVCRIQSLFKHKENEGAYFNVLFHGDKGCCTKDVFNEDIRPVPLTPEILEKNGFVNVENTQTSTIIYSFRDSLFRIEVFDFNHITMDSYYTDSSCDIFISSIHELQHALRLCGIKKEIEL